MTAMTGKLLNSWTYPDAGLETEEVGNDGGGALRAATWSAGGGAAAGAVTGAATLGTTNSCPQAGHGIFMP